LKRRNTAAVLLLLLSAVLWILGMEAARGVSPTAATETTLPEATQATVFPYTSPATAPTEDWTEAGISASEAGTPPIPVSPSPGRKAAGVAMCFLAVGCGILGVFRFRQNIPLLGPDGAAMVMGLWLTFRSALDGIDYLVSTNVYHAWIGALESLTVFLLLLGIREVWGWIGAKFTLSWSLLSRLIRRFRKVQWALLSICVWILTAIWIPLSMPRISLPAVLCFGAAGVFGAVCLWQYSRAFNHYQQQLANFRQGLPVLVQDGAFSESEAQLQALQEKQEEAIRAAVTSERFKVELIANVSHDLRTPLTAILGYGELLQKEELSPEGQEQLSRLNQKAGYMRELVESLFELTKVSSGVLESKRDKIDLIRLLEQTIGLLDDQLAAHCLTVRRHYESDSVSVVTDGSRMHQVFANLLNNAIKYALPGTRIHLEVRETERCYRVRMVNTASYEMDFQPEEIMQRFARGDKARSTQGSGLGLAIAQTYTESVGGTFRVAIDGDQFSAIVELPKTDRIL